MKFIVKWVFFWKEPQGCQSQPQAGPYVVSCVCVCACTHVCTPSFGHAKAGPGGCSQRHFTWKNGVRRRTVKGVFIVSVSWQTMASAVQMLPRDPFPGSGPGCGQGSGRNKAGESLMQCPQGIFSPAGSQSQFAPSCCLKAGAGSVW